MNPGLLVTLCTLAASAALAGQAGTYRHPAIHGDTVVFTAEGDLWKVAASGGAAQRLTSHPGTESHAAISPDGTTVAFVAAYEGPEEVYTMPLSGGLPTRRTFRGRSVEVVGWTPSGKVVFSTRAFSTLPETQIALLDPVGGTEEVVPLAQAADGTFDEAGRLFFTRLPFQGSHTRRYVGGMAQQLWRFDPGAPEAVPLTADYDGTSKEPMSWRGRVYFLSDRDGTMNLWSMLPDGTDLRQHTTHADFDASTPSLSEGRIAYKLGADVHVYDIAKDTDRTLEITLASDFDQTREKWIDEPMEYLTSAHLAPKGDRVVLTARGQVFVAPVTQGRLVEATRRSGVRYRSARFMPDGKEMAVLSDESGEVEWWRLPANGVGAGSQVSRDGATLRFDGEISPDGALVATWDQEQDLWIVRLDDGRAVKVAHSPHWGFGDVAWSPDSAWLAYAVPAANFFTQIKLYRVADGATLDLTSDRTESGSPAWSPDGKWIYFLSDRNLVSAVPSPWGPRQPEPFFDRPSRLYAVALVPGLRFPFAPDDELKREEGDAKAPATAAPKGARKPAKDDAETEASVSVAVRIDAAGLQGRLFEVPVPAGDYANLSTDGKRLFFRSFGVGRPRRGSLVALEITGRDPKPVTLVENAGFYELSADRKKILVRTNDTLAVFDAGATKVDLGESKVDLSGWAFSLDPREEWRQMFREAWRLERDYFWDRGMHGLDWTAIYDKYAPLVERVTDRGELSDLLAQMVSELAALHIFVYGGDHREGGDDVTPGSLGAELVRDEAAGGYRVAHVLRGDPDYPDEWSPLARPGAGVGEGDVVTLIDGVPTLSVPDPALLLRNRVGKQVLLRVKPAAGATRDVIVEPIGPEAEADLRYAEWELTRRERVETASGGDIGYVHLRAMGGGNYTEWARNFYPAFNRRGLIVDVRHNRGGNIDAWILEKLLRKAWFYWQGRADVPDWNMHYAFRGHVVVLVDQRTASDGEAFAEGFRRLGLGKVIGMRTWGGEIWLSSSNVLVDKGIATAAETGVYGPEGEWLIEGWGVEPDIVVDNLPHATFNGEDAQLDAAVAHLKALIAADPRDVPAPPPYPDKSRTDTRGRPLGR